MNFENSKNFESHRLLLNFADKINIMKYVDLSNLSMYYTWKKYKKIMQKQ